MRIHPCYGQAKLFDSTAPDDHARARQLCVGEPGVLDPCPLLVDGTCEARLREALTAATGDRTVAPEGTWAGRLLDPGAPRKRGESPCGTPSAYERHRYRGEEPCQPCKTAHTRKCREAKERARARAKEAGHAA